LQQQRIAALADELAGGQVKNLAAFNGGIEAPIKILQWFEVAKAGGLLVPPKAFARAR
jgi:hypothetical protein